MFSNNLEDKAMLKSELKHWEHVFEKTHGRKPTGCDVKSNPEINAKYKLYHKLFRANPHPRDQILNTKISYVSSHKSLDRLTPQKKNPATNSSTPLKGKHFLAETEAVGPTPQQNGRMLGLFDGIDDSPVQTHPTLSQKVLLENQSIPERGTPSRKVSRTLAYPHVE
jgi:hypothetical protein